jgi:serine/threonine-protein kinase
MNEQTSRLNSALAGRYRIERHLGEGGMATVYLADDLRHRRRVALKLLKPELAAVLGADRFVQEITTTASLQHPHILPLFDSGNVDGFLFYVMPYVEGETLREKLSRETQLGVDEAVRIAREVADALDYAHRHGVIHRDIKPENVLLHDGRPMVADFGIALAVSAAAGGRMTETGLSLGTPHYMSPEQATAEKEITARSDVYSLGSVLYEMLTGQPPHHGGSAQQVIMKIITAPAEAVTVHRKSVPANVTAAVAKSLEKLPADRFPTAKAFSDALGNPAYSNATDMAAAPHAVAPRSRRLRDAVVVGLLVAGVAVPGTWWLAAQRVPAPRTVRFAFSTAPDQPLGAVINRTLAISPDGRTLAYSTLDSVGRPRLVRRALDDLAQQPIPGTEGATTPFFSPDGRSLGFYASGQLKKIPVDGGVATPLATLSGVQGASWGPDGIVVSASGKLVIVPSGGGTPVPLRSGDSTVGYWPVVIAGGKAVAYATTTNTAAEIAIAVPFTGRITLVGLPGRSPVGVAEGELIVARTDGALVAVPFDVRALRMTGSQSVVVQSAAQGTTGQAKAALSDNGSLVYVGGSTPSQLVAVDMHGAARPLPVPPGVFQNPRYSPDGRRIAAELTFGGRKDIWIYDVASGAAHRVTSEGSENSRPEWTIDGARVLFRTNRSGAMTSLWWQPADGSGGPQELLSVPGKEVWEGIFTPDGRTLVFRTGYTELSDIWYRHLAGDTTVKAVATTPFTENSPRVSPNGQWVAYQSNESGEAEVVVQPFPGPGAHVTVSIGGGTGPVWSRDGRRLFYMNRRKLMVASVTTSPPFTVTTREVLFEADYVQSLGHASYDVAPDGKSLLMLSPVGGNNESIVVIENWASELHARGTTAGRP